jgi:hypothetical protein
VKALALFQELAQNVPDNARVHEGLRNAFDTVVSIAAFLIANQG